MKAQQSPNAPANPVDFCSSPKAASAGKHPAPAASRRLLGELRDWLIVAWVLWWSWAYVQGALAHRFPHWLGWTRTLW